MSEVLELICHSPCSINNSSSEGFLRRKTGCFPDNEVFYKPEELPLALFLGGEQQINEGKRTEGCMICDPK